MKTLLIALILGAIGWSSPVTLASDRSYTNALYVGDGQGQFELVGHHHHRSYLHLDSRTRLFLSDVALGRGHQASWIPNATACQSAY